MSYFNRRQFLAVATPLAACCFTACRSGPKSDPSVPTPPEAADLLLRYNARTEKIKQLRARAEAIELRWTDRDGKKHYEQGDGLLSTRKPGELLMTVGGKVGGDIVVLGGNAERFWLFDLKAEPLTAYNGLHADLDERSAARYNIPARPNQLLLLLGLHDLPALDTDTLKLSPVKEGDYAAVWLHFPVLLGGTLVQQDVLVDVKTATPRRIVFKKNGETLADAALSGYEPVATKGVAPGGLPQAATRIEVTVPQSSARITLHLSGLTSEKINDAQFDFDTLKSRYKPEKVVEVKPE